MIILIGVCQIKDTMSKQVAILLETIINAPVERVFDLARSIDLHQESTSQTHEKAVGGRITGLLDLNETVTWEAKHLGVRQRLTTKMIELDFPRCFKDVMISGAFQSMEHVHQFKANGSQTIMIDIFSFKSPLGIIGDLVNRIFLTKYMTRFLESKNQHLKLVAEGVEWEKYIK